VEANAAELIALQLDHVSRSFETPEGREYRALDDISFGVPAGAFLAIVGPSGCGKSTVLNITAGLLAPDAGGVRVFGEALTGLNRRATYMFQQDALLPWKDVRDNVALGLTLAGVGRSDAHARADRWLGRVGLTAFARHFPAQLSGGMRKRAAMAQNWIIDREILLMDEPFSALDIHTRQRMEGELLALWEQSGDVHDGGSDSRRMQDVGSGFSRTSRKTVIFVTHDLEEAIALADEVIVLSAGPASRVVSRHRVTLDRPRDLLDLRMQPAFLDLYRSIWADLRQEVIKSQRGREVGRG
jgi:NitT/TauT family transport system ATP-binding protein